MLPWFVIRRRLKRVMVLSAASTILFVCVPAASAQEIISFDVPGS